MSTHAFESRSTVTGGALGSSTPLIFNRPDLQDTRQRWLHWTLTLLAWVVWVYLWLPLITLVSWYLGLRIFVREIVVPDAATMLSTGIIYLGVVAFMALVLIGWSRYNLKRFGGEDRRQHPEHVSDEAVRRYFGVASETLGVLRARRSMTVAYDDEGQFRSATPTRVADSSTSPPDRARHAVPEMAHED